MLTVVGPIPEAGEAVAQVGNPVIDHGQERSVAIESETGPPEAPITNADGVTVKEQLGRATSRVVKSSSFRRIVSSCRFVSRNCPADTWLNTCVITAETALMRLLVAGTMSISGVVDPALA